MFYLLAFLALRRLFLHLHTQTSRIMIMTSINTPPPAPPPAIGAMDSGAGDSGLGSVLVVESSVWVFIVGSGVIASLVQLVVVFW